MAPGEEAVRAAHHDPLVGGEPLGLGRTARRARRVRLPGAHPRREQGVDEHPGHREARRAAGHRGLLHGAGVAGAESVGRHAPHRYRPEASRATSGLLGWCRGSPQLRRGCARPTALRGRAGSARHAARGVGRCRPGGWVRRPGAGSPRRARVPSRTTTSSSTGAGGCASPGRPVPSTPRATPSGPSSAGRPWPSSFSRRCSACWWACGPCWRCSGPGRTAVHRWATPRTSTWMPSPTRCPPTPAAARSAVVRHARTGDHRRVDAPRGHPARGRRAPAAVTNRQRGLRRGARPVRRGPGRPCGRWRTSIARRAGRGIHSPRPTGPRQRRPTAPSTPTCAQSLPLERRQRHHRSGWVDPCPLARTS